MAWSIPTSLLGQRSQDCSEVIEAGFNVFDDVFARSFVSGRLQGRLDFIFEPEEIEAAFVAGDDVGV